MQTNGIARLLAHHDAAARQLLDRIELIAGVGSSEPELARTRVALAQHFADYQLLAETSGRPAPRRDWMRRAVLDAEVVALPAVARLLRRELGGEDSFAA